MGVGSRGQDSQGRARPGAQEADSSRDAPTGVLQRPVPSLLDEANDKFAHFDGLVCLESDDLLPGSGRRCGENRKRKTEKPSEKTMT